MGTATSSNAAYLMEGISITTSAQCSGQLYQTQQDNQFVATSVNCGGDFDFGLQMAQQDVNCRNDQQVAATAKAAATQAATSGISGLAAIGTATANNIVDMQQNIAENISGRCDATLQQNIQGETYSSGPMVVKGSCNVFKQAADQRFTCTNSIIASASESESATQKATATVTGLQFPSLLIILIILFVFMFGGEIIDIPGKIAEDLVQTGAEATTDTIKAVGTAASSAVTSGVTAAGAAASSGIGAVGSAAGNVAGAAASGIGSAAVKGLESVL